MNSYSVRFYPEDIAVAVSAGTTLHQAQAGAGLSADAPCGGQGSCGKCAVDVRRPGENEWRRVLACQTAVDADMEVLRLRGGERLRVLTDGAGASASAWSPLARPVRLRVPPCALGDSAADWTRLCAALDEALGRPTVWQPNLALCRGLGSLLARTGGEIWAVVSEDRVLEVRDDEPQVYMAAFDLGTTSIAGYLIHVNSGKTAATGGLSNPQARYGGDVISRADYALKGGTDALSGCARDAIDGLTRRMCAEAGVPRDQVYAALIACNTAMHHLFLGISPDSLARAPYNPVVSEPLNLPAADYGLAAHPSARLYMLPVIGGFVGSDTVACLLSGDWLRRERPTLMMDIGTNGELVMGDRRRRVACSTAAGPAFEGAKIQCGMRGADGAIDHVWLEDGAVRWHVIGGGPAKGICGSGLVDLAAALLATGELSESGRLQSGPRYDIGDTGVFLSQRDVSELQLAKAAMAAGILLLAERLGIGLDEIEEVDIAGAFGNYINPDSACAIGLIPGSLRDRVVPVGNAAGEGARLAMADAGAWRAAQALARGTEFLELAALPQFQDVFIDELAFPEEDEP